MTTEQNTVVEATTTTEPTQTAPNTEASVLGADEAQTQVADTTTPAPTPEAITADSYDVSEIDGFDFNEFKGIEENKAFLDRAAAAGITNDQMKFVLSEYNQNISNVMGQMSQLQNETCTEALQAEWGAETKANIGFAMQAAKAAGLTTDDINNPTIGNNPAVIKMLAHFGKQLGEDIPPKNTQQSSGEDVQQLMMSEAYSNPKHPEHHIS